jgi:type IV secretory system conjugative DNA transfer VirD4/TraG family protein
MSVSTYLELYLTLFGWYMYGVFWDIITESGLAYLPFIGMFLRNIVEPVKSQEAKDASGTSLRRIEIDIFIMFTVVVLAVQPYMSLKYTGLSYTKACSTGKAVNAGKTGTTYDSTFTQTSLGGGAVKIPIWWYSVLAVIGGFNDAAILGIPCSTDIRLVSFKMANARITDPHLRRQVQFFHKDCHNSAMTTFLDKQLTYPKALPKNDLHWLGSQYFLGDLYKKKRASIEIPGFRYDKNRDLEYNPKVHIPVDGKPTCEQWWTGKGHVSNIGLRDALAGQIETSTLTDFKTTVAKISGKTKTEVENIAIKTLISREKANFNGLRNLNMYNDASLANMANSAAATLGGFMESISFYPAMYMMKTAAPIIQATVLMLIYMLMPFYFLFSSYNIGKMIFMSIIVFSVKFWTVLWAVAHWLDNHLMESIKPSWFQLYDAVSQNNYVVTMVINFVIAGLFVVMPLFWSGLLTWAGHKVGNAINDTSKGMRESASSAGERGGNTVIDKAKKK